LGAVLCDDILIRQNGGNLADTKDEERENEDVIIPHLRCSIGVIGCLTLVLIFAVHCSVQRGPTCTASDV